MTTIVPGPKIPRSSGTTWEILGCPKDIPRSLGTAWDILGCPTRHDYQSPRSKRSQEVLGQLGTSRDVLPHMIPKSQVQISQEVLGQLGTTWDNLGGPTTHDYHSYRSKEVLVQLRISRDVLPDMTTIVPGSKIPRSPGTTCEILGCPKDISRSPGTTRDIQGCPTSHDYHSPRSKYPKKSWDNLGDPGMSYHT